MIRDFWHKDGMAADEQMSINTLCVRALSERMAANAAPRVQLK
jgi:hypothetical protein